MGGAEGLQEDGQLCRERQMSDIRDLSWVTETPWQSLDRQVGVSKIQGRYIFVGARHLHKQKDRQPGFQERLPRQDLHLEVGLPTSR